MDDLGYLFGGYDMGTRLMVTLMQDEAAALARLAYAELRDPREQLRLLLRQELIRRGLLASEMDLVAGPGRTDGEEWSRPTEAQPAGGTAGRNAATGGPASTPNDIPPPCQTQIVRDYHPDPAACVQAILVLLAEALRAGAPAERQAAHRVLDQALAGGAPAGAAGAGGAP